MPWNCNEYILLLLMKKMQHDTTQPGCVSSFLSSQAPVFPVIRHFTAPVLIAQIDSFAAAQQKTAWQWRREDCSKELRLVYGWMLNRSASCVLQKEATERENPSKDFVSLATFWGLQGRKQLKGLLRTYKLLGHATALCRDMGYCYCYCSLYNAGFTASLRAKNFLPCLWQSLSLSFFTPIFPVRLLCSLLNLQHRVDSTKSTSEAGVLTAG